MAAPVIDDRLAVGTVGHRLAIRCFGKGSPTVILESGTDSSGIEDFPRLTRALGEQTTACAYDRLGVRKSDRPTERRRTLDDAVADLHGLIDAADLAAPYVLVGASGGGLIALHYAGRYSDQVAGVVLLDVPRPIPKALAKEFPGRLAWRNPEHLDWVDGERRLARLRPMSLEDIPLRIVTATDGQSSVKDQSVWLKLSSDARQTTIAGGHDLHWEKPESVVAEIQSTLEAIRG
jgi:pimeloyl-ACP methyl ester carboxylesterase